MPDDRDRDDRETTETVKIGIVDFSEEQAELMKSVAHQSASTAYMHGCIDTMWLSIRIALFLAAFFFSLWYLDNGPK